MRAFVREMRRSRHRTAGCVIAAALVLALAGCGSRSTSEDMLVEEALDATFDEPDTLTSTLETLTDGTTVTRSAVIDGTSECDMHISKGQLTMDLLVNDSGAYTRGSEKAFRQRLQDGANITPVQIEMMADRWVKRGEHRAEIMRNYCHPKTLRATLEETLLTPQNLSHMEEQGGTLNGRETTKLILTGGPSTIELQIAAEGTPYLLEIVERGGVIWTFSDFDKPYRSKTPAKAIDEGEIPGQIIDAIV